MKKYILSVLAIVFLASACQREVIEPENHEGEILMSAITSYTQDELDTKGPGKEFFDEATKTAFSGQDENDQPVSTSSQRERIDWQNGDKIYVNMLYGGSSKGTAVYTVGGYQTATGSDKAISETTSLISGSGLTSQGSGQHLFLATYPAPSAGNGMGAIAADGSFSVKMPEGDLGYSVTHDGSGHVVIADNMDYAFMVARQQTGGSPSNVSLSFLPYFNAYQFVMGNAPYGVVLEKVVLSCTSGFLRTKGNAALQGSINPGNGNRQYVSAPSTSNCTREITYDFKATPGFSGDQGIPLQSNGGTIDLTLLALPIEQGGISVSFTFRKQADNSSLVRTITLPSDRTLAPYRKLRIYNIGANITYEFGDLNDVTLDYQGGTATISSNFVSTKTVGGAAAQTVGYSWQHSTDGGTSWTSGLPSWVSVSASGNGLNATLSAIQASTSVASHDELSQDWRSKQNFNLATYNVATGVISSSMTTANCYVVSGYGTYHFPLVYGNSVQGGSEVSSAPFVNCDDNTIQSSYVAYNRIVSAEVLWTDTPGLVTNLQLHEPEQHYLSFEVPKATIRQGNAVLAIKDNNGNIAWSWHIWVTDQDLTQTSSVSGYSFAPVNLGWVGVESASTTRVLSRSCLLRAVQDESGNTSQAFVLERGKFEATQTEGSSLYYQWGRKDPLREGGTTGQNASVSVGTAIKNPTVMYRNSTTKDWCAQTTSFAEKLWNNNGAKTIYDPCPVGFKVPPRAAFQLFSSGDFTPRTSSPVGIRHNTVQTLFFHASGNLQYGGSGADIVVNKKNRGGAFWANEWSGNQAGGNSRMMGYGWTNYPNQFVMYLAGNNTDYAPRHNGNCVRPVRE